MDDPENELGQFGRAGLNLASGVIPLFGGFLAAIAGAWGEREQQHVNNMLRQWIQMLQDELNEKGRTIAEVIARLDMQDEEVLNRIESEEYQILLKKAFRNWSSVDSERKRQKVRNILTNAAASRLTSDDVVKLFIDWIAAYSDFHFEVIGQIYNNRGVSRGQIWRNLGKPVVREDSAEADLYRMLYRGLSTGGVIRQHRETDYHGNFVKQQARHVPKGQGSRTMESAFEDQKSYELTGLGEQFVHYAMTEITPRIEFSEAPPEEKPPTEGR